MSTESFKPKRRFTRLARNVVRSKEDKSINGQGNVVTAISTDTTVECNQEADALSTANNASIPSDMLYILQEMNGPVIESKEQKSMLESTQPAMTATRRATRLNKATITKEPVSATTNTDTTIPNDILYIMNSLNEETSDAQHNTQKSTESNRGKKENKRKLKTTTTNTDELDESNETSENVETLNRSAKKKKGSKSRDGRSSNKPSTWMDRDQQAVDALEQLAQPNQMNDEDGKDFNALLMEHINIADSKAVSD
jgi:hypothetical protein